MIDKFQITESFVVQILIVLGILMFYALAIKSTGYYAQIRAGTKSSLKKIKYSFWFGLFASISIQLFLTGLIELYILCFVV